ncbi:MAG: hypothetical protein LHW56_05495 [Candidatus Cloacimonetes bacterium]|jgi:predicted nucleic acid-binding protein|nr:hypothetical protein [Candidatus Cloacimonadota bacterium]MDY0172343.1 hypothetical protein [Candidatus Cloacimonadaceae bacterium]
MILLLDSTVMMNCIDRCKTVDLIKKLAEYPYDIEIVNTVYEEYVNGAKKYPQRCNLERFNEHIGAAIKVIDDSLLPITHIAQLMALDAGELFSATYLLEYPADRVLCTDDKATHKALQKLGVKCLWTANLLQLLHQRNPCLLEAAQLISCFEEMKQNGFFGIPTTDINLELHIDIQNYIIGD